MKPLEGIKILDFSQLHGAAFASMLLADFGAEVIKVEKPEGDYIRQIGPKKNETSLYHTYLNRNKKSIVIDLKTTVVKKVRAEQEKKF